MMIEAEPRVRVSALLRWGDGILLCRHDKRGRDVWLLPGGGVHSGETLIDALRGRSRRRSGSRRRPGGPIALVDSIAPGRSLTTSTSSTSSSPGASRDRSRASAPPTMQSAATACSLDGNRASSSTRRFSASSSAGNRAIRRSILERYGLVKDLLGLTADYSSQFLGPRRASVRPEASLEEPALPVRRTAAGEQDGRRAGRRRADRGRRAGRHGDAVGPVLRLRHRRCAARCPRGRLADVGLGSERGPNRADSEQAWSRRSSLIGCASCSACRSMSRPPSSPAARWRT